MDDQIGRLRRELDRRNLLDDTVVVLLSQSLPPPVADDARALLNAIQQ